MYSVLNGLTTLLSVMESYKYEISTWGTKNFDAMAELVNMNYASNKIIADNVSPSYIALRKIDEGTVRIREANNVLVDNSVFHDVMEAFVKDIYTDCTFRGALDIATYEFEVLGINLGYILPLGESRYLLLDAEDCGEAIGCILRDNNDKGSPFTFAWVTLSQRLTTLRSAVYNKSCTIYDLCYNGYISKTKERVVDGYIETYLKKLPLDDKGINSLSRFYIDTQNGCLYKNGKPYRMTSLHKGRRNDRVDSVLNLTLHNETFTFRLSRLVACAAFGLSLDWSDKNGKIGVDHIDENPMNNVSGNLQVVSNSVNTVLKHLRTNILELYRSQHSEVDSLLFVLKVKVNFNVYD